MLLFLLFVLTFSVMLNFLFSNKKTKAKKFVKEIFQILLRG